MFLGKYFFDICEELKEYLELRIERRKIQKIQKEGGKILKEKLEDLVSLLLEA